MYRIVKRIVHTITTVTWLVRLEGESADGKPLEKEITFPATVSLTEEVVETKNEPNKRKKSTPSPINGSKGGRSIRNRTTTTQTPDEPPDDPYSYDCQERK